MKERKQYIKPESFEVRISSLLNGFGGNEGDAGFGSTPKNPIEADARENSFFESNVFEEEEHE